MKMFNNDYKVFSKFSELTIVKAVRSGLVMLIPILLIGCFSLVLKSLPIPAYQEFLTFGNGRNILAFFDIVYTSTFGIYSIYLTFAISYSLVRFTKEKNLTNHTNHLLLYIPVTSTVSFVILSGYPFTSSVNNFGSSGVFIAILSSIVCTYLFLFISSKIKPVRLSTNGANTEFSNSVKSIAPCLFVIIVVSLFSLGLYVIFDFASIQELFSHLTTTIFSKLGNNFVRALCFIFSVNLMWFFGVHGNNALDSVCASYFSPSVAQNLESISNGQPPTEIISKEFLDVFVNMGGSGTIMCLMLAILIFSRMSSNRGLAKTTFFPVLFNISELMTFGLPIIFNVYLLIPFFLTPIVCFLTAYFATSIGLVPVVTNVLEWTTPVFYGGYYATGGSVAGIILQIVNLIIGIVIYAPFIKLYDKSILESAKNNYNGLVKLLQESENNNTQIKLCSENNTLSSVAKSLANELKRAMDKNELELYYQPQYHLNGNCIGAEALLRWNHPIYGLVYPPLIIKLADELGCLTELEKMIVSKVASDAQIIQNNLEDKLKISVNVTGKTMQSKEFFNFLNDLAEKVDVVDIRLCLEITEQTALLQTIDVEKQFDNIKKLGYLMAIDDFSMGHTSLKYLQINQFDCVKIDGSLIKSLESNPRCADIVASIVQLSHSLNFEVVAEFVSNEKLRDILADIGCVQYQGWYYSKAIPFDEFTVLLNQSVQKNS